MRWLKKVNSTVPWPWTEVLASRKDMTEITEAHARALLRADDAPVQVVAEEPEAGETSFKDTILALDTKDSLVEFAESHGIDIDKRKSVKSMQAEIIESLEGDDGQA